MKSKDVLEVLSGKGVTVKSSASLEPAQFELLLNALTTDNQIDNIGDYLDGVTYIPSKKNEKNAAAAKPAQTDAKDAKADAPKAVKAENQDNNIQTEKIDMPKHVDFLCEWHIKRCISGGMNSEKYTIAYRKNCIP